jgi:hypothetical protein
MGVWEWIVTTLFGAAEAAVASEGEVGTRGAPALPASTNASHSEAATGDAKSDADAGTTPKSPGESWRAGGASHSEAATEEEAWSGSGQTVATANRVLRGDGTWGWVAEVDGEDIVIRDATASWFGGDDDPQDNGETASGAVTKGHPDLVGFALPMDFGAKVPATAGAPLPRIPWHTPVAVSLGPVTVTGPLIDLGPAKSARHQVDLTQAAFRQFAPLSQGLVHGVTVRIEGAARYVAD